MPDTGVVALLLVAIMAFRVLVPLALVVSVIGLFTRDRRAAALALLVLAVGYATAFWIATRAAQSFVSAPPFVAITLPFFLGFTVFALRVRQNRLLRWAFLATVLVWAVGYLLIAAFFLIRRFVEIYPAGMG